MRRCRPFHAGLSRLTWVSLQVLAAAGCSAAASAPIERSANVAEAVTGPFTWKGYTWMPTAGGMAGVVPGDPGNVTVDASGYLHLKITNTGGAWTASEVFTSTNLGFGTYQWQIAGPIDRMDHTVVLGLFPYGPTAGIGADGTNEIDTEFSFWNDELPNVNADWGVYPPTTAGKHWEKDFQFSLNGGSATTARIAWSRAGIVGTLMSGFQPVGSTANLISTYTYAPPSPTLDVPQQALPLGMNLWCYKGVPASGMNVEVVIQDFLFVPEGFDAGSSGSRSGSGSSSGGSSGSGSSGSGSSSGSSSGSGSSGSGSSLGSGSGSGSSSGASSSNSSGSASSRSGSGTASSSGGSSTGGSSIGSANSGSTGGNPIGADAGDMDAGGPPNANMDANAAAAARAGCGCILVGPTADGWEREPFGLLGMGGGGTLLARRRRARATRRSLGA